MVNASSIAGYLTPTTPLPVDDEFLGRRLSNLVAGVTGLPGNLVRPRWQRDPGPIPGPDVNWAAVGVISYPNPGGTPVFYHVSDGDGHNDVRDGGDVQAIATFYGPSCSAYARLCRTGLWVGQNWEQLGPLGISLRDTGDVTIVPEKVNETWYRRADLSIILTQSLSRDYEILNVLSANGVIIAPRRRDETVKAPFNTENLG